MTPKAPLTKKIVFSAIAAALIAGFGFTIGWHFSPDETLKGYGLGYEDGYSIGYNDGRSGALPDPHRLMTEADYALRRDIGGREPGE